MPVLLQIKPSLKWSTATCIGPVKRSDRQEGTALRYASVPKARSPQRFNLEIQSICKRYSDMATFKKTWVGLGLPKVLQWKLSRQLGQLRELSLLSHTQRNVAHQLSVSASSRQWSSTRIRVDGSFYRYFIRGNLDSVLKQSLTIKTYAHRQASKERKFLRQDPELSVRHSSSRSAGPSSCPLMMAAGSGRFPWMSVERTQYFQAATTMVCGFGISSPPLGLNEVPFLAANSRTTFPAAV